MSGQSCWHPDSSFANDRVMSRFSEIAKGALFRVYRLGLRAGLVILPNHYYVAEPDILALEASRDEWARPSLTGVDSPVDRELESLRAICKPFRQEIADNRIYLEASREGRGPGFGFIEAQVLHCFLRSIQPPHIIEVGSGVSTSCALHATAMNERPSEITCVEPYPKTWLTHDNRIELVRSRVQAIPVELFESLAAGDFLFIDSSHAVKTGSDVNFLVLEVLPRLKRGVLVHFHDVSFPYDYSPDTLRTFIHPQETALLNAYLIGNRGIRILFSLSRLHHERPEELRGILPDFHPMPMHQGLSEANADGHFPSSLYLEIL